MLRLSIEKRSWVTALISLLLLTVLLFGVVALSIGMAEIAWRLG